MLAKQYNTSFGLFRFAFSDIRFNAEILPFTVSSVLPILYSLIAKAMMAGVCFLRVGAGSLI